MEDCDVFNEIQNLKKQKSNLKKENLLANENFVKKAPASLVEQEKEKLAKLK